MSDVRELLVLPGEIVQEEDWMLLGVCRSMDTETFFPENITSTLRQKQAIYMAKAACNLCKVRQECLDYAIANGEKFGIWGGQTPEERGIRSSRRRNRVQY